MSTQHLSTIKPFFNEDTNTFIYGYITADNGIVYLDIKSKGTEGSTNEVTLFNDSLSAFGLINNIHTSVNESRNNQGEFNLPSPETLPVSSTLTYNIDIDEYLLAFLIPYQYTVQRIDVPEENTFSVPITYYLTFRYVNDGLVFIDTSYKLPELPDVIASEYADPDVELEARYSDLGGGFTKTYDSSTGLKIPNYSRVVFNCVSAVGEGDVVRSVEYKFGDSEESPNADRIESRTPLTKVLDNVPREIDRVVFDPDDNADITNPLRRVVYHTYSLPREIKSIKAQVKIYTFNRPNRPYIYNYDIPVKPQNVYDMFDGINIINANLLYDNITGVKSINLIYETINPRYITYMRIDDINTTFIESVTKTWTSILSTPTNTMVLADGINVPVLEDGNYLFFEVGT